MAKNWHGDYDRGYTDGKWIPPPNDMLVVIVGDKVKVESIGVALLGSYISVDYKNDKEKLYSKSWEPMFPVFYSPNFYGFSHSSMRLQHDINCLIWYSANLKFPM